MWIIIENHTQSLINRMKTTHYSVPVVWRSKYFAIGWLTLRLAHFYFELKLVSFKSSVVVAIDILVISLGTGSTSLLYYIVSFHSVGAQVKLFSLS